MQVGSFTVNLNQLFGVGFSGCWLMAGWESLWVKDVVHMDQHPYLQSGSQGEKNCLQNEHVWWVGVFFGLVSICVCVCEGMKCCPTAWAWGS